MDVRTKNSIKDNWKKIGAIGIALLLSGCSQNSEGEKSNGALDSVVTSTGQGPIMALSKVDINSYPVTKTVCDPLGGEPAENYRNGLRADLFYKLENQPILTRAMDYELFNFKSSQNLFFADVNVPTRVFTDGFSTKADEVLMNDQGEKLIEYFGIKYESSLALSSEDAEGEYEIALLSDDGTVMKIFENGRFNTLIDNDNVHESKLKCSSRNITLTRNAVIPFQLYYFQGPREHISNLMLWRKVDPNTSQDPLCNAFGNNYWFDLNNASAPKAPFLSLLDRGWQVVGKENFWIYDDEERLTSEQLIKKYNPCTDGQIPVISNIRITENSAAGTRIQWTTDIPATSQVIITDKESNQKIESTTDNALRLEHSVLMEGLRPFSNYSVQALSISETLGVGISEIIEFATLY